MVEVDARRLFCPLPVIRLQNCINKQIAGTRVRVVSTDPGSMNDIPTWCRINGHQVLESQERDREYIFLVQKGDDGSEG
ncbi:MAG: sulfurtransferase TusA family protein [Gammaproteobacteria bacterium]|nr:MAG: sulfurtransferase TusA family protein [Gammaproteobacteria bacterium]